MAVDQIQLYWLTHCYREQAPSHIDRVLAVEGRVAPVAIADWSNSHTFTPLLKCKPNPTVGGGLPPMAVDQIQTYWLIHCYREQAPSHIDRVLAVEGRVASVAVADEANSHTFTPLLKCKPNPTVGGGLPPMAVDQIQTYWLTHCYREQAPSHIDRVLAVEGRVAPVAIADWSNSHTFTPLLKCKPNPTVGGGLPPMAVDQIQTYWLIHCYREQAPSHIDRVLAVEGRVASVAVADEANSHTFTPLLKCKPPPTLGGGLPSMAVDQIQTYWLTHCYRGQAPSHIARVLAVEGRVAVSGA